LVLRFDDRIEGQAPSFCHGRTLLLVAMANVAR